MPHPDATKKFRLGKLSLQIFSDCAFLKKNRDSYSTDCINICCMHISLIFIQFDCFMAPLKNHGSWVDRKGKSMSFLDGNNPNNSICSCGANNTCRSSSQTPATCNCNAIPMLEQWFHDSGKLNMCHINEK